MPPVCIQKEGATYASVVFKKHAAVKDGDAEGVQFLFGDVQALLSHAVFPHEELIEGIKTRYAQAVNDVRGRRS